ncbi:uncharacterized protein LOC120338460 [Styela clava]|uniref:uncharacterized protein LOC120338460 n=1 Tax=Styela clava TaxID=7725 RepID=UPI001939937E|nr:uncharacterized protein LOC120338460 [Styela clava]
MPAVGRILGTSPKNCCGVGAASHTLGTVMHILEIFSLCCGRKTNNTLGDFMCSIICIVLKLCLTNWNLTEDINKTGTACYWTCAIAAILNYVVFIVKSENYHTEPFGARIATLVSMASTILTYLIAH